MDQTFCSKFLFFLLTIGSPGEKTASDEGQRQTIDSQRTTRHMKTNLQSEIRKCPGGVK